MIVKKILIMNACVAVLVLLLLFLFQNVPWFAEHGEKLSLLFALALGFIGIGYLVIIAQARKSGDFPTNIFEKFLYVNWGIKIKKEKPAEKTGDENEGK